LKKNRFFTFIVLLAVAFSIGLTLVVAQSGYPADGRINVGDHVGGNAVYCLGEKGQPSGNFEGGITVVSTYGKTLLLADPRAVDTPLQTALRGELTENMQVASAIDAYGRPLDLYVLTSAELQLNGYDEHGKPFTFIWTGCDAVLPPAVAAPATTDEP
jgi:hypothetical protein